MGDHQAVELPAAAIRRSQSLGDSVISRFLPIFIDAGRVLASSLYSHASEIEAASQKALTDHADLWAGASAFS
jgi:hypothetical protein